MATYQIEATIEKLEQNSIQLKGTGEYLFEKSSKKKKSEDKEYCNIFELKPDKKSSEKQDEESSIELKSVKDDKPIYFAVKFKDLLTRAFIEKKNLKFDLLVCEGKDKDKDKDKNVKYTITAVSHAST
jgi:hypothetical protein